PDGWTGGGAGRCRMKGKFASVAASCSRLAVQGGAAASRIRGAAISLVPTVTLGNRDVAGP
ncbi:MAG: hypothetical protein ACR2RF_10950, partial [Geminicoccaceae bacterium]